MAYKGTIVISSLWHFIKMQCNGFSINQSHFDKSVHEIRRSIKCIRSFIFLIKKQVPLLDLDNLDSDFRSISRKLAPLRDSFVMKQTFAYYKGDLQLFTQGAVNILESSIGQHYLQLKSSFAEENILESAREDFARLTSSFDFGNSEIKVKDLQDRVAKSYRKCKKLFKRLSISSPPDKYHRFRKWSKKYQFQLELMNEIGTLIKNNKLKKKLEKLNEHLGADNDLNVLTKYIKTYNRVFYKDVKPHLDKQKVKNRKKILALSKVNYN